MSRASFLTLLAGAVAGAALTWAAMTYGGKEPPAPPQATHRETDAGQWLLEPGTTLETIFQDGAVALLEEPERVTLHELSQDLPGDAPDAIVHGSHAFRENGADARVDPLLRTVRSISSYRNVSMCEFKPAVLLRFTREDRHLDLLFCFGCQDMLAYLDGKACGGAGLSDEGYRSFLHRFRQILPGNELLKAASDVP